MTYLAPRQDETTNLIAKNSVRIDVRWGPGGARGIVATARRGARSGHGAAAADEPALGAGLAWVRQIVSELGTLTSVHAMWAFAQRERDAVVRFPAAWAAIEIALLDLFAQEQDQGIAALLGEQAGAGPLPRAVNVSDEVGRELEVLVVAAAEARTTEFNLRMCGRRNRDRARLEAIRDHVPDARVRVLCGGLFSSVKSAYGYLRPFSRGFWAMDSVIDVTRTKELAQLSEALERPVVIASPNDVHAIGDVPWVADLDLSRAGGLLRALELARAAQVAGREAILSVPAATYRSEAEAYRILKMRALR